MKSDPRGVLKKSLGPALAAALIFCAMLGPVSGCKFTGEEARPRSGAVPWPEWVFHHWVWLGESTQDSAIELVQDYIDHDIPVGAIIIDSPWETGYNTFVVDPALYPEPQAMVDWFHGHDVRVVFWITSVLNAMCEAGAPSCPEADLFNEAKARHFLMGDGDLLIPWWKCPGGEDFCGGLIDYFNPEAVAWWHDLIDPVLDLGIDGWKCDGTDPFALLVPISPYAGVVHPWDYTDRYYRDFFEYTRRRLGNDRVIMARSVDSALDLSEFGIPGVSLYAPFAPRDVSFAAWVGDQSPTWDGMHVALTHMLYSAIDNYLIFGSDLGGYRSAGTVDPEIFLRWAGLASVCPLMENGGNSEHRPWMIGGDTVERMATTDIYRRFVNLHYKLIPYMQAEARMAWFAGGSLWKVLESDEEIWKSEFLLGADLLVAPIYETGNTRTVSFPEGDDWVYLWDRSRVHAGGTQATVWAPLTEYPIFVRKGSPLESDPDLP
ncbi:MAG TPA: TIM-barrel domain-containing protein [bacterium]|nr:TIM-barrel domain-containing protein [bacterium]